MIKRDLAAELTSLARQYPVVTVLGPRQSGKTTLVRAVFQAHRYVNLEDSELRGFALHDPKGLFASFPPPVVLDEIQRVPELCSLIQVIVDESKRKGDFILTGSAQLSLHQAISQSLAGRNALATLLPLSLHELQRAGFALTRDDAIYSGMYPRIHAEGLEPSRAYRNYIQTYVERDVRNALNIRNLSAFERFLGLLAGRVGQVLNLSSMAGDTGISSTTLGEWLSVLEASFIVYRLRPFHENYGKRLIKAPKLFLTDTGPATALLGIKSAEQAGRDPLLGQLFENLVVMDFVKAFLNRGEEPRLYFFRDQNGREVDLVVERDRVLHPIEIKASQTWNKDFLRGIRYFQAISDRAGRGLVIYAGARSLHLDNADVLPFTRIESFFSRM